MKNLTVHLDDKPIYDIVYEESFDALPSMMKELGYSNRKICVVSESHVASLYLDAILLSSKMPAHILHPLSFQKERQARI